MWPGSAPQLKNWSQTLKPTPPRPRMPECQKSTISSKRAFFSTLALTHFPSRKIRHLFLKILGKIHDHRINRQGVARLDADLLDGGVALGAQDVLHLHRLHHAKRLPGLDLLALGDLDGPDQSRH